MGQSVRIVGGLLRGRSGGSTGYGPMTKTVHIAQNEIQTICGVNYRDSRILCPFPEDGDLSEVNCKRCLRSLEQNEKE